MRNQNRITPAQARQLMQQRAMLWDVRTPAEYAAGHIPSARNVPLDRLEEELPNLPSNGHPVIVCCRSGQRSAIAAELLAQANTWEVRHGGFSGRTAQQFIYYLNSLPKE